MLQLCNSYESCTDFIHMTYLFGWLMYAAHFRLAHTSASFLLSKNIKYWHVIVGEVCDGGGNGY